MKILVDTVCPSCQAVSIDVFKNTPDGYPACTRCGATTERLWSFGAAVRGDEIPGGLWIEHGLCHADGSPRRFDSWTEIKRECQRRGLTRWTDMYDESATKDGRVYNDWLNSGEAQRLRRDRVEARRAGVRR